LSSFRSSFGLLLEDFSRAHSN